MKISKTAMRIFVTALIISAALVAAVCLIVHTKMFRDYLRAEIVSYAESKTGAKVDVQSIVIHWSGLGADVYGLQIRGREGVAAPPVFAVDHLAVSVRIASLWRRQFSIESLILDHPVIHLAVDAEGRTNLPEPPAKSENASAVTTLFNMAIRHFQIQSGQFYYNDERIPLSAQMQNLATQIWFNRITGAYNGSLDYERGRITVRTFQPIEHSASLDFSATRTEFEASPLAISSGRSRITLDAQITGGYAHPKIGGRYQATLFTPELSRILNSSALPEGEVATSGTFAYQGAADGSFIDGATVGGDLASPKLLLTVGETSLTASGVHASYRLASGTLEVPTLDAALLGGRVAGSAAIHGVGSAPRWEVNASLRRIALPQVSSALPQGSVRRIHLTGEAGGSVRATWSQRSNLVVQAHVAFSGGPKPRVNERTIPLNGVLDVRYDAARDVAILGQSHLQTGNTALSISGTLSKHSKLQIAASTTDLHETAALAQAVAAAFQPQPAATQWTTENLGGSAQFRGQVSGSLANPAVEGELDAGKGYAGGFSWTSVRANVSASSSKFAVRSGFLEMSAKAKATFSASAGLQHWSLQPTSLISARVDATQVDLATIGQAFKRRYPVSGTLSATVDVHGTRGRPSGRADVRLANASAWNQPISDASLTLASDRGTIRGNAQVRTPAGEVGGSMACSLSDKTFQASLNTAGIKLERVELAQRHGLGLAGTLVGNVSGHGKASDPQITADLQFPQLQIRGQVIEDGHAQLEIARRTANFTVRLTADKGQVQAKGRVNLTGDYVTTSTLDVTSLPIGALLASYVPGAKLNLKGQAAIHAQVSGPLRKPFEMQGSAEVENLNVAYQSAQIALVRPLRMSYAGGVLKVEPAEIKGPGTELTFHGTVPVRSTAAVDLGVRGTVDLSAVQQFVPGVQSSGRLDVNLMAQGEGSSLRSAMHGDIRIENAAFTSGTVPIGIDKANGDIEVSGGRIQVKQFTASAGGGTLTVEGTAEYGRRPQFDVTAEAQSVRVRYPEGIRSVLNANLRLNGTPGDSRLSGNVQIDRLSFTQQFDLSTIVGQFADSEAAAPASGFERHTKMDIHIQSSSELRLASSKLSMAGAASLNVTGTLASPVVLGRVTLSSGEIFFLGKRYDVQSGTIEFSNPVRTEPVLNVYVETTVEQYKVTLSFTGPMDRLRTNYTAEPALSPTDIINLLAFGQTSEEAASAGTTPATIGAESVLAQGVTSRISSKLENLTGISQLTINPMSGSNQSNPGAQVALQERVTGSLLLTFSTDVTSTQNTAVQVQYDVTPRVSVSVLRDQNGGYAIDLRVRKTF